MQFLITHFDYFPSYHKDTKFIINLDPQDSTDLGCGSGAPQKILFNTRINDGNMEKTEMRWWLFYEWINNNELDVLAGDRRRK